MSELQKSVEATITKLTDEEKIQKHVEASDEESYNNGTTTMSGFVTAMFNGLLVSLL